MQHEITASWDTLESDSTASARYYLREALRATEDLPKGVNRTEVIVALINASASAWNSATLAVGHQRLAEALNDIVLVPRTQE